MHNIVILLKPIFDENHNHYYYQVHKNSMNMLYHDQIGVSESASKEYIICCYWYFLDKLDISFNQLFVTLTMMQKECIICHYRYFLDKVDISFHHLFVTFAMIH